MCGQRELKEHFSSYVEDYNTATMPDEKYYNLRKWYLQEQERIAREGSEAAKAAATFERTAFDDEAELKRERYRTRTLVELRTRRDRTWACTCPALCLLSSRWPSQRCQRVAGG
eukprot:1433168-Prymnesium_polylepis.1